jgi:hypothetical protein
MITDIYEIDNKYTCSYCITTRAYAVGGSRRNYYQAGYKTRVSRKCQVLPSQIRHREVTESACPSRCDPFGKGPPLRGNPCYSAKDYQTFNRKIPKFPPLTIFLSSILKPLRSISLGNPPFFIKWR